MFKVSKFSLISIVCVLSGGSLLWRSAFANNRFVYVLITFEKENLTMLLCLSPRNGIYYELVYHVIIELVLKILFLVLFFSFGIHGCM